VKRARTAGRPSFFGTTLKGLELSGGKFDSQTFMTAYGVPDHPKLFIIKLSTNQSMECKDSVAELQEIDISRQANKTLSMFREGHYRQCRYPCTLSIQDDMGQSCPP
jgi:hypothetical protein